MDNQTLSISENAFQIVRASEEVEGFEYDWNNVSSDNLDLMKNISKDVVVEFLKCPETKITVVKNENNQYEVIAHNAIANETIKINNMGNHFMGLVKVVEEAMDYKKRKELDPNTPLIRNNFPDVFPPHFSYMQANDYSSDFIREVNEQILLHRYGEIGIGDYRTVDLFGKNVDVMIASMEHGVLVNSDLKTEKSTGGNVVIKMKELIDWANNEAFKNSEPEAVLEDIAKFHARFIQIHPFRDGNGRTARLLTNYFLLANDMPMMNIPASDRKDYINALDYALLDEDTLHSGQYLPYTEQMTHTYGYRDETNKYYPLRDVFSSHLLTDSNNLVEEILGYNEGVDSKALTAEQVELTN